MASLSISLDREKRTFKTCHHLCVTLSNSATLHTKSVMYTFVYFDSSEMLIYLYSTIIGSKIAIKDYSFTQF